jgi:cellobiose phosphorylase
LTLAFVFFNTLYRDHYAVTLAGRQHVTTKKARGKPVLIQRLDANVEILRQAYNLVTEAIMTSRRISSAEEWLVDNFWMISEQIHMTRKHLPPGYSKEMPTLENTEAVGFPRIYGLVLNLISLVNGQINEDNIYQFVKSYQKVVPLSIGEVWGIPIMLRLGLLENIRLVCEELINARKDRNIADKWADRLLESADKSSKDVVQVLYGMSQSIPKISNAFVLQILQRLQGSDPLLSVITTWLSQQLSTQGLDVDDINRTERYTNHLNLVRLRNSIISLRFVNTYSWKEFVENQSHMEAILRKDPSGIYSTQDFETRDSCRHVVEGIAMGNKIDERNVAKAALKLAVKAHQELQKVSQDKNADQFQLEMLRRKSFVGYWLLDSEGVLELKETEGYSIPLGHKITKSLGLESQITFFLGSIGIITLVFVLFVLGMIVKSAGSSGIFSYFTSSGNPLWVILLLIASLVLVGSQLGVSLTNSIIVHMLKPRLIPRMDLSEGIPDEHRTMVVVPTLLTSLDGVNELIFDLRARFLVNRDKNIYYALITDFTDSKTEHAPNDNDLVNAAVKGIEELNKIYPNTNGAAPFFYLFHRPRKFNKVENVWMGWERKRGKLTEFTQLLRGGPTEPFSKIVGDLSILSSIRYVITLDTDTMLPSDSARKLIGNAAHIMNKPVVDPRLGRVVAGYGLLQPRVSVGLTGAFKSLYAYINSLDSGLDPYTKYVSDVYQDTFGEGSFIGKGLYHVDPFLSVFSDLFPENRILSHDLIEGCYVRSGLVSDVELIEEYPSSYLTEASRRHRWVRGDWQIASWVLPFVPTVRGMAKNPLSLLSKWKIFDNLRRSLVPAAMLFAMMYGWMMAPFSSSLPYDMSLAVLSIYLIPSIIDIIDELIHKQEEITIKEHFKNIGVSIARRALGIGIDVLFMPFEAYNNVDALIRCLVRIYITKTKLLEWNTSTAAAKMFAQNQLLKMFRTLWFEPTVIGLSAVVLLYQYFSGSCYTNAFTYGLYPYSWVNIVLNVLQVYGFIAAWMSAPIVAWYLSKPIEQIPEFETVDALQPKDVRFLRLLARKTWRFFETFVREEDNYLPLDNFQEFPKPMYARRTSPTNIAMGLLGNISAWDFGFITMGESIERTAKTLHVLTKMERYRGHFYNWYDTSDLRPLAPRYVSSVDSGNLIGYLILMNTALLEFVNSPILQKRVYDGLQDTIACAQDVLAQPSAPKAVSPEEEQKGSGFDVYSIQPLIAEIERELATPPALPTDLPKLVPWVEKLLTKTRELVKLANTAVESLRKSEKEETSVVASDEELLLDSIETSKEVVLQFYAQAFEKQLVDLKQELQKLLPWAFFSFPDSFKNSQEPSIVNLRTRLFGMLKSSGKNGEPSGITLNDVAMLQQAVAADLNSLKTSALDQEQKSFLNNLAESISVSSKYAEDRIQEIKKLAALCNDFANQDFSFLYNSTRNLISIGYNVDHKRLDNAYYDTFCSEARLCSYALIAKGQLPVKHWFSMSRLLTSQHSKPALLSWSGSMFEYLMPLLVMPTMPGTLLHQTYHAIVLRQIEYGQQKKVPWGISESAYNMMDAGLVYQYGPFGVPGLGLKRGLSNDLVVAPYASALALMVLPVQATKNLEKLASIGLLGVYGLYEAVDFTPHRLRGLMPFQPIRSYFAHHSGMTLLSLAYTLLNKPMQRRFSETPEYHANELLLQEKIPRIPFISNPNEKETTQWSNTNINTPSSNRRYQGLQMYAAPEIHLISNGRLHVMVSVHGAGYINYKDIAVTRWREDVTLDGYGISCYLRDVDSKNLWSTTSVPIVAPHNANYSVMFSQGKAEFKRNQNGIVAQTVVTVSPHDDVEVRRVSLTNNSGTQARRIELTSYGEVILGSGRTDAVHRAFSNLFVQTEILKEYNAILCMRKTRTHKEKPMFGFHIMLIHDQKCVDGVSSFETDRHKFIGRNNSMQQPQCMADDVTSLSNTSGYPLDPIFAIRQVVRIRAGGTVLVDFITGVAATREQAIKIIQKYQKRRYTNHVIDYSWISSQKLNFRLNITEIEAQLFGKLAGCLVYSNPRYRASPRLIAKNRMNQSGLWRSGISGDLPIILVRIGDTQNIDLVSQCLQAHAYLRANGLLCDLVVWNDETSSYRDDLHSNLLNIIGGSSETAHMLQKPGGIFPVRGESLNEQESTLLYSVARVVLSDTGGRLVDQINRESRKEQVVPQLLAKRETSAIAAPTQNVAQTTETTTAENAENSSATVMSLEERDLLFNNGFGGFDKKRREYIMLLQKGKDIMPAPWVNILANEQFGCVVSEKGSSYTWFENAHEYRLTPWNNDPVVDGSGEAYYIRDEDSGHYWSPTLQSCPGEGPYVCRHGMGYSVFEHVEDGIRTETTMFVPTNEPIKIVLIKVKNQSGKTRNLSVTGFVEWTLGELRERTHQHIITSVETSTYTHSIMARNPYHLDFGNYVGFFSVVDQKCTVTADRSEFIGFNRTLAQPAAMERVHLSNTVGAALDPCGAIQVPTTLENGKSIEIAFVLGAHKNQATAKDLIERIRSNLIVRQLLKNVKAFWNQVLTTVQVETPDDTVDLLANGWLLYQVLSARIWGRSGFYQSSGAFGFRDQLQDSMAVAVTAPHILKQQIMTCCEHQFEKGDVCHWWHPQSNRGTRTTFSDDYMWLPLAVAHYVDMTGDDDFLDMELRFCTGINEVHPPEESNFDQARPSDVLGSVYEHCKRAIKYGLKYGTHGIPLMGCGDWNDGMNLVGIQGRGESVWLGFFMYFVLGKFMRLAEEHQDTEFIAYMNEHREKIRANLEKNAWDGEWYMRAFFDDGEPLGAKSCDECQIDSLPQSWSIISGAGDKDRSAVALDHAYNRLVRKDLKLIQLFDPPFEKSHLEPGYIKGYAPGVRENGGQYTHAAIWMIWAFAQCRDFSRAWELFDLVNPINHARNLKEVQQYRVEPYVVAADVYTLKGHEGQGGWTWYTGSAGWMYRLIIEQFIGLKREVDNLVLQPFPRADWKEYKVQYRYTNKTIYKITFTNYDNNPSVTAVYPTEMQEIVEMALKKSRLAVLLDGNLCESNKVQLVDDNKTHNVQVFYIPK